ncbi:hypothetical protein AVEN_30699-1 [Araneus ventricosus]|uniref:Reverse transcriptase domain-containing protein n=1 Tax=Araneus ventricosus TaxID=182803 RepID=A0A4Y2IZ54_ARAVE|nr:hypothetical protein AVEN_30699-1 [Araneus ventricosus]
MFSKKQYCPSPENSTVDDLKQVSRFELLKMFNIFLFRRKVPVRFCRARTVFIPKKSSATAPVIDELVRELRGNVGISIVGLTTQISAYTDDILLFASSPPGLHLLLDKTTKFLSYNLEINTSKSFTSAIATDAKNNTTKVDNSLSFKINNSLIRSSKVNEPFNYIGISFSAKGLLTADYGSALKDYLIKLKSAPRQTTAKTLDPEKHPFTKTLSPSGFEFRPRREARQARFRHLRIGQGVLYPPGDCPNT